MTKFNVTYEIVTPESAEHGEPDETGFIAQDVSLRYAIELVNATRTNRVDCVMAVECDESPIRNPQWVTVINGCEFDTGAQESRSLHMPDNLTASTRRRIAKLVGALY